MTYSWDIWEKTCAKKGQEKAAHGIFKALKAYKGEVGY